MASGLAENISATEASFQPIENAVACHQAVIGSLYKLDIVKWAARAVALSKPGQAVYEHTPALAPDRDSLHDLDSHRHRLKVDHSRS
jgi:hypothetical protein